MGSLHDIIPYRSMMSGRSAYFGTPRSQEDGVSSQHNALLRAGYARQLHVGLVALAAACQGR